MSEKAATRPRPFEIDPAGLDLKPEPPAAPAAVRVPVPFARNGNGGGGAKRQQQEEAPLEEQAAAPARTRNWRKRLLGVFGLALFGSFVFASLDYVGDLIDSAPFLGWPLALLLAVVCVSAAGWTALEVRDLSRLSARASLRRTAERLAASELHGEAEPLIAEVRAEIGHRPELATALRRYEDSASDALSDSERLRLFEKQVMAPVDRSAYRLVLGGGRDIALLTALSPLGLLDGLLVLWRTTVMLRSVAQLYGMAPGAAATLTLLRRCLRNATLAGLADVVSHAALEHAGAGLLALVSARAGQGAGNALLASRLGLEAIRQCRPLPFVAEEEPRLARMRRSLFEGLPKEALPKGDGKA